MSDLTLLGFPRSTFVQIVGLVLTHKDVPYTFRDLEPDMGSPVHLALHPFDRVPILQHGDFTLYETSAIPSDENVVAHALPKIEVALQVMERQLAHGWDFPLGSEVGLADYYLCS